MTGPSGAPAGSIAALGQDRGQGAGQQRRRRLTSRRSIPRRSQVLPRHPVLASCRRHRARETTCGSRPRIGLLVGAARPRGRRERRSRSRSRRRPLPARCHGRGARHAWWSAVRAARAAAARRTPSQLADGDIVPVRGDRSTRPCAPARSSTAGSPCRPRWRARRATRSAALRIVDRRSLTLPGRRQRLGDRRGRRGRDVRGAPAVRRGRSTTRARSGRPTTELLGSREHRRRATGRASPTARSPASPCPPRSSTTTPPSATTDCGLGQRLLQPGPGGSGEVPERSTRSAAADQLVLFVPAACASGASVGEGTVGSTLRQRRRADRQGRAPPSTGRYAHETGHNYGFAARQRALGRHLAWSTTASTT